MIREVPCSASTCKAPMVFVKVEKPNGEFRTMPLDAKPSREGRWFINENVGDGSRNDPHLAEYVGKDDARYPRLLQQNLLHTPHHATCPASDSFRRKARKEGGERR